MKGTDDRWTGILFPPAAFAVSPSFLLLLSVSHSVQVSMCSSVLCIGSKGSMKDAVDSEEDLVPFSGQDDRRPLRARKTMKLQDVDAVLREMRYIAGCAHRIA